MAPPKYAKPKSSHHEKVEGVSGTFLMFNGLLKVGVMINIGNLIPNDIFPCPCYHPNEMSHPS